jgi:transglutaminase-like putative cysteine protease
VRFQATHKLVTYLLVATAFATLASGGEVSPVMAAVFLGLVAVSWRVDAGGVRAAAFDRRLTLTRLLVAAVLMQRTWVIARQLPDPDLMPVVDFVLLALGTKLCYRRNNRDDVHVFVLSFLLVLAAAVMGGSFLFAPAFIAYVVVATWALVLFHLRREMEENYLVKHSSQAPSQKVGVARILNSRRVVGRAFFIATGGVALAVAAGAAATFALVPRVGAGFVFGAARGASAVVGFSDDVSLGRHGTLANTATAVALRARLPDLAALPSDAARARAVEGLYWRGTVYDRYDSGHWTRSRAPALRTMLGETHGLVVVDDGAAAPRHATHRAVTRQEIDLAGTTPFVAFALDRPVAFDVSPRGGASSGLQLVARWSDEVGLRAVPAGSSLIADAGDEVRPEPRAATGTHYVALSVRPTAREGRAPALPPEVLAASLDLPASLSPRVTALAQKLAAGAPPGSTVVKAVTTWLRDTHQYTLDLPRPAAGMDPVESFLFEKPAGHCEYFASAAALLLRAAGVPTRYVNGYVGGEWNALGGHVTVRDNRAHSWIEAYLPESGWTRVDATPSLPAPPRTGRARQLMDSLDYQWSRFVVGYDLAHQLSLAQRVARGLGLGDADAASSGSGGGVPGWALVLAAVVAFAAAASRVWPTRRPRIAPGPTPPASAAPVQRLYARALERLARAGLRRGRSETPREFAARVRDAGADGEATLAELTELYTAARFGGRPVTREQLRGLARRLGRLAARQAA